QPAKHGKPKDDRAPFLRIIVQESDRVIAEVGIMTAFSHCHCSVIIGSVDQHPHPFRLQLVDKKVKKAERKTTPSHAEEQENRIQDKNYAGMAGKAVQQEKRENAEQRSAADSFSEADQIFQRRVTPHASIDAEKEKCGVGSGNDDRKG